MRREVGEMKISGYRDSNVTGLIKVEASAALSRKKSYLELTFATKWLILGVNKAIL